MFEIDIDEVLEAEKFATAQLSSIPREFAAAGREAARASREGHSYVNRTGITQAFTRSHATSDDDHVDVNVMIGVQHASYLMKGGTLRRVTSLTAMENAAETATKRLEFFVEGMESAIGSK
jgi:hypothetical protein